MSIIKTDKNGNTVYDVHTHIDMIDFIKINLFSKSLELSPGRCAKFVVEIAVDIFYSKGYEVIEKELYELSEKRVGYKSLHIILSEDYHNKLGNIANLMKCGLGTCIRKLIRLLFIVYPLKFVKRRLDKIDISNERIIKPKISKRWRKWRKHGKPIYSHEIKPKRGPYKTHE